MPMPCYDPVTGKPEWNPNNPGVDKPVMLALCPCDDTVVFNLPLGAGLTGCTTGNCGNFTGDWPLSYYQDFPEEAVCNWTFQDAITLDTVVLALHYNWSAELTLYSGVPAVPREICWYGIAAVINCIGNTVFGYVSGTCTGPATLTLTGA